MTPEQLVMLSANQRFLVRELERRRVVCRPLDLERGWLVAERDGRWMRLIDIDGPGTGYSDCLVASHKHLAKALLRDAGLSVPTGGLFRLSALDEALAWARSTPPPWVLKPCFGSQGAGVYTDLSTLDELRAAVDAMVQEMGGEVPFLIEEQAPGVEHRLFITGRGDVAVTRREAAHVIGDGRSTIRKLIYAESDRRTWPKRSNAEGPIPLDGVTEAFLARQGLGPEDVPPARVKVALRGNSNLKTGGTCADATDVAHDSLLEIGARVRAIFPGAPVLGIDVISADVAGPQDAASYRIIEVNTCPGLGMHMSPGTGQGRDAAAAVADVLFPETAVRAASPVPRRLPACRIPSLE